jgi:hypothetical protein
MDYIRELGSWHGVCLMRDKPPPMTAATPESTITIRRNTMTKYSFAIAAALFATTAIADDVYHGLARGNADLFDGHRLILLRHIMSGLRPHSRCCFA